MRLNTKMPMILVSTVALGCLTAMAQRQAVQAPAAVRTDLAQTVTQMQSDMGDLDKAHHAHRDAAEKLSALYAELSRKVDAVVKAQPGAAMQAAVKELQQAQATFNLQYQQLQQRMQNENRQYTTISNVLKTKHDTVKNSINNVR
jgi:hypothetical protein